MSATLQANLLNLWALHTVGVAPVRAELVRKAARCDEGNTALSTRNGDAIMLAFNRAELTSRVRRARRELLAAGSAGYVSSLHVGYTKALRGAVEAIGTCLERLPTSLACTGWHGLAVRDVSAGHRAKVRTFRLRRYDRKHLSAVVALNSYWHVSIIAQERVVSDTDEGLAQELESDGSFQSIVEQALSAQLGGI